jgi:hypothetical protein
MLKEATCLTGSICSFVQHQKVRGHSISEKSGVPPSGAVA